MRWFAWLLLLAAVAGGSPASAAAPRTRFESRARPAAPSAGNLEREETSVAIDPANPRNVVIGANDFNYGAAQGGGGEGLGIYASHDGGRTWDPPRFVDLVRATGERGAVAADPSMVFDRSGVLYYSGIAVASSTGGVVFTKSFDAGRHWTRPVLVGRWTHPPHGRCYGADKDYMTVDARGVLYIVYTRSRREDCMSGGVAYPYVDGSPIVLVTSRDGGRTWSKPVLVSASPDGNALGAVPAVDSKGRLYVVYNENHPGGIGCLDDRSLLFGKIGVVDQVVAVSRDGGRHFSHRVIGALCANPYLANADEPLSTPPSSMPALGVDGTTVYAAWSDNDLPRATIHLSRSLDGGRRWSVMPAVDDIAAADYFPWLSAREGVVRLIYQTVLPGGLYRAVYRESANRARSWTPALALDDAPACAGCPSADGSVHSVGDYWGINAVCGLVVPAWADAPDGSNVPNVYVRIGRYATRERCRHT